MNESCALSRHMVTNRSGHILVKASEQNWSDHDSSIKAESGEEASAFESDIRSSYDESLARRCHHWEKVIAGDTKLSSTWNIGVRWPSANSDYNFISCNLSCCHFTRWVDLFQLKCVFVDKWSILIEVLDFVLVQIHNEPKVKALNVHLNVADHRCPVGPLLLIYVPSLEGHVFSSLSQDCRIVHHLLRDATNIYTGTSEAPFSVGWCWLDKVCQGGTIWCSVYRSSSSAGYTSASTTNHENIVIIFRLCNLLGSFLRRLRRFSLHFLNFGGLFHFSRLFLFYFFRRINFHFVKSLIIKISS